jgi:hypothetical protein
LRRENDLIAIFVDHDFRETLFIPVFIFTWNVFHFTNGFAAVVDDDSQVRTFKHSLGF